MAEITVSTTFLGFGTIPTTSSTTATYDGVTFTFDTSMPVGYFFDGEPFVVSTSAFNITSISPASAVIDTWQGNGAMKDPLFGSGFGAAGGQGFDAIMGTGNAPGASQYGYTSGLNIDPAVGGNIAIAQGEETSIVKSVRKSGATDGDWQVFEKYVTLTVLSAAPAPGTVMPSPSATTKTLYNVADIDLTTTRSITMPGSFTTTPTSALASVPTYLAHWGVGGEIHRRFRLDEALTGSNYSAYLVPAYARLLLTLHADTTTKAEKYQLAARILRHAAQVEAIYDHFGAFEYNSTLHGLEGIDFDAGQGGGVHLWIWAAAFLLKNSSLKTKAEAIKSQLVSPFWLTNSDVGVTPSTRSTESPQPTFPEQVGLPEQFPEGHTTDIIAPYKNLGATVAYWEALSLLPLQNFGGDWAYSLTGGVHDTTNDKAAVIAFMDRVRTWDSNFFGASDVPSAWKDLYDTLRPYSTMSQWTGQPEQFPYKSGLFTAGDGQIAWDTLSYDYATETVTQRDFRYSLDRIQWIVDSDVATTGTKTGLLKGAAHWCGLRQHSTSGAGAWSLNFPVLSPITSGTDRGKVTTTGTDTAAAPANTVAPKIHIRTYDYWVDDGGEEWLVYDEATSPLATSDTVYLAAGVGYWTGYPAPTFTYQWKRDGSPIGGATSATYQRVQADAEAVLTCEVTATNASGSASITTAGITMPALATIPAGTLIDSNMDSSFLIDYETEWGNVLTFSATAKHLSGYQPTEDYNRGAIRLVKSGARAYVAFELSRNFTAGSTYRVQAQMYAGGLKAGEGLIFDVAYTQTDYDLTGNGRSYFDKGVNDWRSGGSGFKSLLQDALMKVDGTTTFSETNWSGTVTVSGSLMDIDITFGVDAGETALNPSIYFGNPTATGGSTYGNQSLHYCKLSEVV